MVSSAPAIAQSAERSHAFALPLYPLVFAAFVRLQVIPPGGKML